VSTPAPTELFDDGRPPPPAAPERVRVALVAAAGPPASDDLYRLLRRRLLTLSLILAVAGAIANVVDRIVAAQRDTPLQAPPRSALAAVTDWLALNWPHQVMMMTAAASAVILWKRPPQSVRGLRVIELLLLGSKTVMLIATGLGEPYRQLEMAAHAPAEIRDPVVSWYAGTGSLFWFITITAYGAIIPNTWRRCLAVTSALAASPLVVFATFGLWLRPLAQETVIVVLASAAFYVTVAVAIAVFSSSRIEILRRQAAEARRLGQYTLRERLGGGGMGEVYRAEHALLRRPCAIKVIRPERAGDPEDLRRFEREVQATAALTHPNTVQVFDYGHAEDGTFYYVMEYLPGPTLEKLVRGDGPLPPARVVHFLRQVCGALAEAHAAGLIHRDVKPGNVIVCERGGVADVAKLLDFGLVLPPKDDPEGDPKLTRAGSITGTPEYLSPEQAAGRAELDARSDLYGVGALGYFLLTGGPPFGGRSPMETMAAHLYENPRPVSESRRDVPAELEAVILRCLAKNPEDRYGSAGEVDAALARVVQP
jgi:serine/threonine-protein kinase